MEQGEIACGWNKWKLSINSQRDYKYGRKIAWGLSERI